MRIRVEGSESISVICVVKSTVDNSWTPISNVQNGNVNCFLSKLSYMYMTIPDPLVSPSVFDDVTTRIMSEETSIQTPTKLSELGKLRDEVFKTVTMKYHWDLTSVVDTASLPVNQQLISSVPFRSNGEDISHDIATDHTTFMAHEYDQGSFVAIRPGSDTDLLQFWLGMIVNVHRDKVHRVFELTVHWFEFCKGPNAFQPKFRHFSVKMKRWLIPWTEKIAVESVLIWFRRLIISKTLPSYIGVSTSQEHNFTS